MIDVVLDDVSNIQPSYKNTHNGKNKILIVSAGDVHMLGEKSRNGSDEELEQHCSKSRNSSYHQGKNHNKGLLLDVRLSP